MTTFPQPALKHPLVPIRHRWEQEDLMPDCQRVPVSIVERSVSGSLEATIDDGMLMLTAPVIDELELSCSIPVDHQL